MVEHTARCTTIVLAFGLLCGCGGAARNAASPTVPPTIEVPPPPDPVGRAELLPTVRSPWIAGTEPDGTRHVVFGSVRATLQGTSPTWAEHRFAAAIAVASRVTSGWVFVATDGAVARSDSFTGPLERLGSVAGYRDRGPRANVGRVTAIDQDNGLWSTDGSAPLARMVVPADAFVLDAAFADHVHGAVAVDGGHVFYTADAGRGWTPVDLGGDAAMRLDAHAGRIVIHTSAAPRYLDPPGALGNEAPSGALGEVTTLSEAEAAPLRDKLLLLEPALLEQWAISRSDGTAILTVDRDVLVVERASGRVLERHPAHLPERCRVVAWGPHIALGCGVAGLFRIESGVALTQVSTRAMPYHVVFSDDGQHAAVARGCDGRDTPTRLCVVTPGTMEPQVVDLQPPEEISTSRALSMHGTDVLVRVSTDAGERMLVVDARSGEVTPLRVAGSSEDEEDTPIVFDAWWVDDGIVGIGGWQRWSEGPRVLLRGRGPTELEATPLPIGARSVGFLDARRGFAIGSHAGRVWQTYDGGQRWTPLLAAIEGLAASVVLNESADRIACRFGTCVAEGGLLLAAEPSARAARPALASTERRRRRPIERYGIAAREYVSGFDCRLAGAPRSQPALPRGQAPAGATRSLSLSGAGARARVDVWRANDGLALQIAWRAEDARGVFSGRSRTMPLTGPDAAGDDLEEPTSVYVLRGASRGGVLVERCGRSTYQCSLLWAAPDQSPRVIDALPSGARGTSRLELEQAIATPTGGFLVLWRGYAHPGHLTALTELDARGQVASRRMLRWAGERHSGLTVLARHGGSFGLAVEETRQPGRLVLHPVSGEPPVELPRIRNVSELGPCTDPESDSATSLWSTRMMVPRFRGQDDMRGRIEISSSGRPCIRSAESWLERWSASGAGTERGVSLRAQTDARMTGFADQGNSRQQLVCTRDRH